MINFKLPASAVKAAKIFSGKQDIRYYLNGIFLSQENEIVATNGHKLIFIKLYDKEPLVKEGITFLIQGTIPKNVKFLEFLIDEEKKEGWVTCLNDAAMPLLRNGFKIMLPVFIVDKNTGRGAKNGFVDYEKLLTKQTDEGKPTSKIFFNPSYLSDAAKAAEILGHHKGTTIKLVLNGENELVIVIIQTQNYKEAKVIVMPCRG